MQWLPETKVIKRYLTSTAPDINKILSKFTAHLPTKTKTFEILKAHNHLFHQFLNVNLHYQQNIYTPYIHLTKFEPLKPSRFGDISLLVFKISKEAVKQPCLRIF